MVFTYKHPSFIVIAVIMMTWCTFLLIANSNGTFYQYRINHIGLNIQRSAGNTSNAKVIYNFKCFRFSVGSIRWWSINILQIRCHNNSTFTCMSCRPLTLVIIIGHIKIKIIMFCKSTFTWFLLKFSSVEHKESRCSRF